MTTYIDNPFKGADKGKSDDTNESQWNSHQRSPKDGSASPAFKNFGDREQAEIIEYPKFGSNSKG